MERTESKILDLIPHRAPMLLINEVDTINSKQAHAKVLIDEQAPFFETNLGVPAWIALEYMGQTAALIAGHQQQIGELDDHLGFLLSARNFQSSVTYFETGSVLLVASKEIAIVGDNLATFACSVTLESTQQNLASAQLSVFRKPIGNSNQ